MYVYIYIHIYICVYVCIYTICISVCMWGSYFGLLIVGILLFWVRARWPRFLGNAHIMDWLSVEGFKCKSEPW